jgi:hypothetical protein
MTKFFRRFFRAASAIHGYQVRSADPPEGERIFPSAITERLTPTSSGALVPIAAASTAVVSEVRRHAGIAKTMRWVFSLL